MFISPMLLHKSEEAFNDDNYISELKLDGIRLIYSNIDGPKLYTRHNNDVTRKFPELLDLPIPKGTILDGELIMTDDQGHPDFEKVMDRFSVSNSTKIELLSNADPVQFCTFDILYHEDEPVMKLPLWERKEILDSLFENTDRISKTVWFEGKGVELFNIVKEKGLEGIVLKDADSPYHANKRSHSWLKVINYQYTDVFITGMKKKEFGWLLGVEDHGRIKHMGVMEFVAPEARKEVYRKSRTLAVDENKDFIYFRPELKCKVKFRNYTKAGLLRIPSFIEFQY
ncbi:ATP-dependent DNA ligase [Bacillus sp. T33-2]|uniref:ATP-dependent DNA ligase n=1 Tax=Bacillus sp. T33-2 TaxID=2054168 RepID=UPI000C778B97|nr:RNA ligase family protein [Bacillus sp. T33-2]PLR94889.1 hypothetical protein CVD19_16380 [Bacillus sp. T33-2]